MSTCNRLDLQTLGSQPIVLKNLPNRWCGLLSTIYGLWSIWHGQQQCPESFWTQSVKILVILNPAGYMLTSFGFALFI